MPYLGNIPASAFSSLSYQDLTGGTGTNFTLDYSVSSAQDIEVFVNNVRQEPGVAYTASGTSLTMTGSIVATDDFYVVFQAKTFSTISHPAGNSLQATSGTFSGAVSAASATVTGDLTVDTDTLYVDSTNNRVGVGTSSPAHKFHTNAGTTNVVAKFESTDATAGIYLSDNTSDIQVSNKSGDFVIDVPAGTEAMRIDSSGNVLVGKTAGSNTTKGSTLTQTGEIVSTITTAGGASQNIFLNRQDATGTAILFRYANGTVGSIAINASSVSYNTSSDYRLKENVVADWDATTRLKQLNPVRFNFIADADTTVDGFLAHEVQSVVPEAISGTHNEVDDEGNPVYQGIDQSKLTPLLTKALIEAVEKIEQLETRIAALEAN